MKGKKLRIGSGWQPQGKSKILSFSFELNVDDNRSAFSWGEQVTEPSDLHKAGIDESVPNSEGFNADHQRWGWVAFDNVSYK